MIHEKNIEIGKEKVMPPPPSIKHNPTMKTFYFNVGNWMHVSGCVVAENLDQAFEMANETIFARCDVSYLKKSDLIEVQPNSIAISKHHV